MILITGGLGFIGSHVTRALLDIGESCVLVQRRAASHTDERVHIEQVDVTDGAAFLEIGRRYPITGIVHLAGAFGASDPMDDISGSLQSLLIVLRAARDWDVARVGVASTIGVYGRVTASSPMREDIPLPMTAAHVIPLTKKIAELVDDFISGTTGLDIVNYRIGAIWGPGGRPASPFFSVPQLVHAAARGTAFDASSVYAQGGIDLCYVKDCGRAIALLQLAEQLNHRTYNVASGRPTSHGDIVTAISKVVPEAHFELRPGRDPNNAGDLYLDTTRLHDDTAFQPEYDTDHAVADYVDWLRAGNER